MEKKEAEREEEEETKKRGRKVARTSFARASFGEEGTPPSLSYSLLFSYIL